ncbi:universal stress protein [Micromonospora echinofusca]|uniref:Universal stress protein n=1 Tax=Micromonospora echinofusca TaxID=47858 RepID=A0ABS3VW51_MICEH|nr:universal stress protein [Micromonospora echinofusca]MBO4208767.1 universal stress protein [Micromonospora echinofusca]
MNSNTGAPVVVGVDGSTTALDAVRLAAREAALRQRPLKVVHAFIWPLMNVPLGPSAFGPPEGGLRNQAERIVAEAVAEAEKAVPGLTVTGEVVDGASTPVLLAAARDAALTVLGNRGLGGFGGLLLGSTSTQVAEYADGPVLVVRGEERTDGPVVVGVDGSELSELAVAFAAEEAARRQTRLVAVHAWLNPAPVGPGDVLPLVYDVDALRSEEERVLAEAVAGLAERYPQLTVEQRLVRGAPKRVLVQESAEAQLVVVGARGHGGLAGMLLGSVSHAVLHQAHCPVVVVRPTGSH